MIKLFLIALLGNIPLSIPSFETGTLSKAEREYAVQQLEESRNLLLAEVKDLTKEQLEFKPGPDKWNIFEIVEHIGLAENGIGQIIAGSLQMPVDTTRRTEILVSDKQIKQILTNRNGKATAPDIIKPTGRFTSITVALKFFEEARDRHIKLIQTTDADWRNRYWQHGATGTIDLYQSILLMSAHCERHTAQIKEVKSKF